MALDPPEGVRLARATGPLPRVACAGMPVGTPGDVEVVGEAPAGDVAVRLGSGGWPPTSIRRRLVPTSLRATRIRVVVRAVMTWLPALVTGRPLRLMRSASRVDQRTLRRAPVPVSSKRVIRGSDRWMTPVAGDSPPSVCTRISARALPRALSATSTSTVFRPGLLSGIVPSPPTCLPFSMRLTAFLVVQARRRPPPARCRTKRSISGHSSTSGRDVTRPGSGVAEAVPTRPQSAVTIAAPTTSTRSTVPYRLATMSLSTRRRSSGTDSAPIAATGLPSSQIVVAARVAQITCAVPPARYSMANAAICGSMSRPADRASVV